MDGGAVSCELRTPWPAARNPFPQNDVASAGGRCQSCQKTLYLTRTSATRPNNLPHLRAWHPAISGFNVSPAAAADLGRSAISRIQSGYHVPALHADTRTTS